jgi:hypothetical protein
MDWGQVSEKFDAIKSSLSNFNLQEANEAQTRFDIIDRVIKEVLGWEHGSINVEERQIGDSGYIDYVLRVADYVIVLEAKKSGVAFPDVTQRNKLKITGSVLGQGDVHSAIEQAYDYGVTQNADVAIVSNGSCWIFYPCKNRSSEDYAYITFPFEKNDDARSLFNYFHISNVTNKSLTSLTTSKDLLKQARVVDKLRDSEGRTGRNSIAEHLVPIFNNTLLADSIIDNIDQLDRCYVVNQVRTKYDNVLRMHVADLKNLTAEEASKVKLNSAENKLKGKISNNSKAKSPPLILLIGSVGSGKSTYINYFKNISGSEYLNDSKARWIHVDFEKMGQENPRDFLYKKLRADLNGETGNLSVTYENDIEPAYKDLLEGLKKGPFALTAKNPEKFNDEVTALLRNEYEKVEPYVDKVISHMTKTVPCIVVLDNIDLFENEELEAKVLSEGISLSKRINTQVVISIRDTTFAKHKNSAVLDAYEYEPLWLDPPNFREVLAKRLNYIKKMIEGKEETIKLNNNMSLKIKDLSELFEILKKSVLSAEAGNFIEYTSNNNVRKGLGTFRSLVMSGHLNADKAIQSYLQKRESYLFPIHEIFKAAAYDQWKYYREKRSTCLNIFNTNIESENLQLLRLFILRYLYLSFQKAKEPVEVRTIFDHFVPTGASEHLIIETLIQLAQAGYIKSSETPLTEESNVILRQSGGYYSEVLLHKLFYVEACLHDTPIYNDESFNKIFELTLSVENNSLNNIERMRIRRNRAEFFLDYIIDQENRFFSKTPSKELAIMSSVKNSVLKEFDTIILRLTKREEDRRMTQLSLSPTKLQ